MCETDLQKYAKYIAISYHSFSSPSSLSLIFFPRPLAPMIAAALACDHRPFPGAAPKSFLSPYPPRAGFTGTEASSVLPTPLRCSTDLDFRMNHAQAIDCPSNLGGCSHLAPPAASARTSGGGGKKRTPAPGFRASTAAADPDTEAAQSSWPRAAPCSTSDATPARGSR